MARFRLRFLLQELDLTGAAVMIGRSPECQITIEDPLVSRQHARISVRGDMAFVMDLGSRNGVRINGDLIRGETPLKHNDRVRLGTQDLVFLVVDEDAGRMSRATGFMLNCRACGRPFPGEVSSCPHCGTAGQGEPQQPYDTVTAVAQEPATSWTLQLLGEVIERALGAGRADEADRMLCRAAQEILASSSTAEAASNRSQIARLAGFAFRLADLQGQPRWGEWAVGLYGARAALLPAEVLDCFESASPALTAALQPALVNVLSTWRQGHSQPSDASDEWLATRLASLTRGA